VAGDQSSTGESGDNALMAQLAVFWNKAESASAVTAFVLLSAQGAAGRHERATTVSELRGVSAGGVSEWRQQQQQQQQQQMVVSNAESKAELK
jgi:hypothetical protein